MYHLQISSPIHQITILFFSLGRVSHSFLFSTFDRLSWRWSFCIEAIRCSLKLHRLVYPVPCQVQEVSDMISLSKLSPLFSLSSFGITVTLMLPFLKDLVNSHKLSSSFFLDLNSHSSFTCTTSRFPFSSLLILSSIWSALLPMFSNALSISLIEFLSSRMVSACFSLRISISLVRSCFCPLLFFLSSLNCLLSLLVAHWISWQLFWILYQLDRNVLWLF